MSRYAFRVGLASFAAVALATSAHSQYAAAFTSDADYTKTFFLTPNGSVNLESPMVLNMIGGGDPVFGGGQWTKVGIAAALYYSQQTEGALSDFKFDIRDSTQLPQNLQSLAEVFSLPLPPDVTSLSQLPALVLYGPDLAPGGGDDLAAWATLAKMPEPIAALEWARYLNLPVGVQLLSTVSQSGNIEYVSSDPVYDLDRAFERGDLGPTPSTPATRQSQCMWDVSNVTDANDNDPGTPEPDNGAAPQYTFSSVSIAATSIMHEVTGLPENKCYRSYVKRNLNDAVQQFLAIASLPRYAGHVVAFAIDPEVHLPAHQTHVAGPPSHMIARHPNYGGGLVDRCFIEDYNPATCLQFARYEQARYGDSTPLADDNGDGKWFAQDFGSDYVTSGWPGINSHTSVPATWDAIDPPRLYPQDVSSLRTAYWQEWINFRVSMLDDYVQDLVSTVAGAGVSSNRVFTHQVGAGSSVSFTRANTDSTANSIFNNSEWLDDWVTMEVSRGTMGSSIYGWRGVDCNDFLYDNIRARGDSWGAPEFNPAVAACNPGVTNCVQAPVDKAYSSGARILWPHAWDSTTEPLFDYTFHWTFTNSLNSSWSLVNLKSTPPYVEPITTTPASVPTYYENTNLQIDASKVRYFAIKMTALDATLNPANTQLLNLRVDFAKNGAWTMVQAPVLRSYTNDTRWFTLDMTASSNWSGTVTGLRVWVAPAPTSIVAVEQILLPTPSLLTTAFKNVMTTNKNNVRADLPATALAIATPFDLAAHVPAAQCDQGDGRVTIYGADPIVGADCNGGSTTPPHAFNNFCVAGNFEPKTVAQGGIQCGGIIRAGIRSPASTYLGLHKTGKFHKLALPDQSDLYLTFRIGVEDAGVSGGDGVRFKVLVRGADGTLTSPFDQEWRQHAWSDVQFVSLDAWRNQVVDIAFEVHAISSARGDLSAWGEPRIVRAFSVSTAALGFGQTLPNPSALFVENEPAPITAIEGPNFSFHHWQATSGLTLGNPLAAGTTVTATQSGTATAVFVETISFDSIGGEDGRMRESTAGSGVGGSFNSDASDSLALRVGDDNTNKLFRSLLSFDTDSIPAGSTIVEAFLDLTPGTVIGLNPPPSDTNLLAFVSNTPFGSTLSSNGNPLVESADFEAAGSTATSGGTLALSTLPGGNYVVPLNSTGMSQIRFGVAPGPAVRTQVKLVLRGSWANNNANDVIPFWSGDAATQSQRPHLVVKYY